MEGGGGGRELSYTRASPLFEARSGEQRCDINLREVDKVDINLTLSI